MGAVAELDADIVAAARKCGLASPAQDPIVIQQDSAPTEDIEIAIPTAEAEPVAATGGEAISLQDAMGVAQCIANAEAASHAQSTTMGTAVAGTRQGQEPFSNAVVPSAVGFGAAPPREEISKAIAWT